MTTQQWWALSANVVGWPLIHVLVSWIFTRLGIDRFRPSAWPFRPRKWERGGDFYARYFKIKRWKSKLPDAAAWFDGGFPKRKVLHRDTDYLTRFIAETCRGEAAHWFTFFCCPIFFLWNPPWASSVMVIYALAANLPCIVTQRYNRLVLTKIRDRAS